MASNSNNNFQHRPLPRNGPPPRRGQGRNPPPSSSSTRPQYQPQPQTQEKRKPVFVKVDQLTPGTNGHNLTVKVVNQNSVPQTPGAASSNIRPVRISECLVGDETASILFTARNDQVELMKPGTTVNLRNAKIDMFKGSMRLAVDKCGPHRGH